LETITEDEVVVMAIKGGNSAADLHIGKILMPLKLENAN